MDSCDVRFKHPPEGPVSIEAVLAGTLCLMSCAMQSGSMIYLRKIVDNLDVLSSAPELSNEMRCVCRRLACHWQGAIDEAARTADAGGGAIPMPTAPGVH